MLVFTHRERTLSDTICILKQDYFFLLMAQTAPQLLWGANLCGRGFQWTHLPRSWFWTRHPKYRLEPLALARQSMLLAAIIGNAEVILMQILKATVYACKFWRALAASLTHTDSQPSSGKGISSSDCLNNWCAFTLPHGPVITLLTLFNCLWFLN